MPGCPDTPDGNHVAHEGQGSTLCAMCGLDMMPASPITALAEGGAQLHELHQSWVAAGIKEPVADRMLIAVITEVTKAQLGTDTS